MDLPLPAAPTDPQRQALADRRRFRRAALAAAGFVALLWWIALVQQVAGTPLRGLLLRPGEFWGLIGIVFAPLLHGSLQHLVSNTLPLLILGSLALATLPRATACALPLIWVGSGIGAWLLGQPGTAHLGASGLAHGLMLFVFVAGVLRRDRPAVAAGLIAFLLYGGMLLSVLPREAGVSWEYHLSGAACGLLAALLWWRRDPAPPRKRYSWEDEEDAAPPRDDELEPPAPQDVPVLWERPPPPRGAVILRFPDRREPDRQ